MINFNSLCHKFKVLQNNGYFFKKYILKHIFRFSKLKNIFDHDFLVLKIGFFLKTIIKAFKKRNN